MRLRTALSAAVASTSLALAFALAAAPSAGAADVPGFSGTWLESALRTQYDLGGDLAFKDAPLLGTHNSFNSQEEMGAELSPFEINQQLDLTDQLDIGIRSVELDLHPDPFAGAPGRPVVCHTTPQDGCTVVKALDPVLAEIARWLGRPENADQVLELYLEDDLDSRELHDDAAAAVEEKLADLVYRPEGGGDDCSEVPGDLTRDEILEAGARVLIVSGCGEGRAWRSQAFSWERHLESRPHDFADYPDCGPDYDRTQYRTSLVRYYEDSLRVGTAGADDGLTPETTAAMMRCGVDLLSFDRIKPLDGRLEASVWSWAENEPAAGRCALMRTGEALPTGRWVSKPCDGAIARPACRDRSRWSVGKRRGDLDAGKRWCRNHGAKLAVPRTGFENQRLRDAMEKRGTTSALLGYKLRRGEWTPLDSR